jgi:hypothetical protein
MCYSIQIQGGGGGEKKKIHFSIFEPGHECVAVRNKRNERTHCVEMHWKSFML